MTLWKRACGEAARTRVLLAAASGLFILHCSPALAANDAPAPASFGGDGYAQLEVVTSYGAASDVVNLANCPTGQAFGTALTQFLNRDQTIDLGYTVSLPNGASIQMAPVDIRVKRPFLSGPKCSSRILPKPYLSPLYVVGGVNTKLNFLVAPLLSLRTKPTQDFIAATAGILQDAAKVSTVTAPFAIAVGGVVTHALDGAGANLSNEAGASVSLDPTIGPLNKSWVLPAAQFGGTSDITLKASIVRVASIFNEQDVAIDTSLLHSTSSSTLLATPYYNQPGAAAQTVDAFAESTAKASYDGLASHTQDGDLATDCNTIANSLSAQGVSDSDIGIIVWALAHAKLDSRWGGFLSDGAAIDSMACISGRKAGLAAVGIVINTDAKKPLQAPTSPPTTALMNATITYIPPDSLDQQTDLNEFAKGSQAGDNVAAVSAAAGRLFVDSPVVSDSAGLVFKTSTTLSSNYQWPTYENYSLGSPFLAKLGCYAFFDMAKVNTLGASGVVAIGLTPNDSNRPATSAGQEVVIEFIFAPAPSNGPAKIGQIIVKSGFDPAVKAYVLSVLPSKTCGVGANSWSPNLLAH